MTIALTFAADLALCWAALEIAWDVAYGAAWLAVWCWLRAI
jgi:hypothetical protein